MTLLALAGWCGGFGRKGLEAGKTSPAGVVSASTFQRAMAPMPAPARPKKCRRVICRRNSLFTLLTCLSSNRGCGEGDVLHDEDGFIADGIHNSIGEAIRSTTSNIGSQRGPGGREFQDSLDCILDLLSKLFSKSFPLALIGVEGFLELILGRFKKGIIHGFVPLRKDRITSSPGSAFNLPWS